MGCCGEYETTGIKNDEEGVLHEQTQGLKYKCCALFFLKQTFRTAPNKPNLEHGSMQWQFRAVSKCWFKQALEEGPSGTESVADSSIVFINKLNYLFS